MYLAGNAMDSSTVIQVSTKLGVFTFPSLSPAALLIFSLQEGLLQ